MLGLQVKKWHDIYYNARITISTACGEKQILIRELNKEKYDKAIAEAFKKLII
ncbi:MAG: hypothetical protein ACTSVY_14095 [Candidatus Helarchaeota archaeon]